MLYLFIYLSASAVVLLARNMHAVRVSSEWVFVSQDQSLWASSSWTTTTTNTLRELLVRKGNIYTLIATQDHWNFLFLGFHPKPSSFAFTVLIQQTDNSTPHCIICIYMDSSSLTTYSYHSNWNSMSRVIIIHNLIWQMVNCGSQFNCAVDDYF